jgi:hypothetical protein
MMYTRFMTLYIPTANRINITKTQKTNIKIKYIIYRYKTRTDMIVPFWVLLFARYIQYSLGTCV